MEAGRKAKGERGRNKKESVEQTGKERKSGRGRWRMVKRGDVGGGKDQRGTELENGAG